MNMDRKWTADRFIPLLASDNMKDRHYVRDHYFRFRLYGTYPGYWTSYNNSRGQVYELTEFTRRVAQGDELAFKAWLHCTKSQKDRIIEIVYKRNTPRPDWIYDGKILI